MKHRTLGIFAILSILIAQPLVSVQSQSERQCRLGDTDATWAAAHGTPRAVGRDAWFYGGIGIYTRSWYTGPPERTGVNYAGYSPTDYSVRYVELISHGIGSSGVRSFIQQVLPADSVLLYRRRLRSGHEETYRSQWLFHRLRPLAGDGSCIDPWGFGPGIIKVRAFRQRDSALRVIVELGASHEKPAAQCPACDDAPN